MPDVTALTKRPMTNRSLPSSLPSRLQLSSLQHRHLPHLPNSPQQRHLPHLRNSLQQRHRPHLQSSLPSSRARNLSTILHTKSQA